MQLAKQNPKLAAGLLKFGPTMDGRETQDRVRKKKCGIKSQQTLSDSAQGVDSTFSSSKPKLCDLKVKERAVLNQQAFFFENVNEQINFLGGGAEKTPDTSIFHSSKSPENCLKMRILVLMLMPLK